ncbi:MAG: PEP-CTERM sorting domain-containing protein [Anaerohalosphaeraceae bacterium]|nr:PEP-CTERM sorting domain-containing protein [Anaerohalosphaeraceae bacterium]
MMKKMLILVLVLCVASIASATNLTWSQSVLNINVGQSLTVQLIASDNIPYTGKWVGADISSIAAITSITKLPAASDGYATEETTYPGWWTVSAFTDGGVNLVEAGAQFDVLISGLAIGTYIIGSDEYGENDFLTINVVPEPMTMAFLGLGGLFLRRRKK